MPDLLKVRESLHKFIDPMWQSGWRVREELYQEMSKLLNKEAHVASMSLEEIEKVARYFEEKDSPGWPCRNCKYYVAHRYYLPVCLLNQQRKGEKCKKYELKECF